MNKESIQLKVVGILSEKLFPSFARALDCDKTNANEIILFCDYSGFEIPVGYIFNTITDLGGNVHFTQAFYLRRVSQEFAREYSSIPKGYKTICKFQFKEKIPAIVKELPKIDDWYGSDTSLIFGDDSR